jgi:hypothetical protein
MFIMKYAGKLSSKVCKDLIVDLISKLPYAEIDALTYEAEDLKMKNQMVAALNNVNKWKREDKNLISVDNGNAMITYMQLPFDASKPRYRRRFRNEYNALFFITELSDTEVLVEWEID